MKPSPPCPTSDPEHCSLHLQPPPPPPTPLSHHSFQKAVRGTVSPCESRPRCSRRYSSDQLVLPSSDCRPSLIARNSPPVKWPSNSNLTSSHIPSFVKRQDKISSRHSGPTESHCFLLLLSPGNNVPESSSSTTLKLDYLVGLFSLPSVKPCWYYFILVIDYLTNNNSFSSQSDCIKYGP